MMHGIGPIAIGTVEQDESLMSLQDPPPGYKYDWDCLASKVYTHFSSYNPSTDCLKLVPDPPK